MRMTGIVLKCAENARKIATESKSHFVGPEHLLAGMLDIPPSFGATILRRTAIDFGKLADDVRKLLTNRKDRGAGTEPAASEAYKTVVQSAVQKAGELGQSHVGTEHLLWSMASDAQLNEIFSLHGVHSAEIGKMLVRLAAEGRREPFFDPVAKTWE
jgi:ATP-dependent Clp protease ATP-binding subunit ClpA